MKTNHYIYFLLIVAAAALGAIAHSTIVRIVAIVILAGASVLMGIELGSNPFKK